MSTSAKAGESCASSLEELESSSSSPSSSEEETERKSSSDEESDSAYDEDSHKSGSSSDEDTRASAKAKKNVRTTASSSSSAYAEAAKNLPQALESSQSARNKKSVSGGSTQKLQAKGSLMALGLKRRDRRTIEEIQRDLKKNRSSQPPSLNASPIPPLPSSPPSIYQSPYLSPRFGMTPVPSGDDYSGDETQTLANNSSNKNRPAATTSFKGFQASVNSSSRNGARNRLNKKILGRKKQSGANSNTKCARTNSSNSTKKVASTKICSSNSSSSSTLNKVEKDHSNSSDDNFIVQDRVDKNMKKKSSNRYRKLSEDDSEGESEESYQNSSEDTSGNSNSEDDDDDDDEEEEEEEEENDDEFIGNKYNGSNISRKRNQVNYAEAASDDDCQTSISTKVKYDLAVESILTFREMQRSKDHGSHHGQVSWKATCCPLCSPEMDTILWKEYLIKWQNKSHRHNTWEVESCLKGGTQLYQDQFTLRPTQQKLKNFTRKQQEIEKFRQVASPEEIESHELQQNGQSEIWEQHVHIDRVIAEKQEEDVSMIYCKWVGLPYADCTWEKKDDFELKAKQSGTENDDASIVTDEMLQQVSAFHSRIHSGDIASFSHSRERHQNRNRLVSLTITERKQQLKSLSLLLTKESPQPSFFPSRIKLFEYQMDGVNWMLDAWSNQRNFILADEMGLGKTIQSLTLVALTKQASKDDRRPALIVVPLSTLQQWVKECSKFVPHLNVVAYIGNAASRQIIREHEWYYPSTAIDSNEVNFMMEVCITTYEMILADRVHFESAEWSHLVVDEAHRLKNHKSELYSTLSSFSTENKVLLTGTPLQNSMHELWCLLHFIQPEKFPSEEDFEQLDQCITNHSNVRTLEEGETNEDAFKIVDLTTKIEGLLQPHLLRRLKQNVDMGLPTKTHLILPVPLSKMQRDYYRYVLSRNFFELNKHCGKSSSSSSKTSKNSLLNIMMELKKVCNHPFLFEGAREKAMSENASNTYSNQLLLEHSGKMRVLDKLLHRLRRENHRVLIFSQMVRVLDLLAEYCRVRGMAYQRLDGSTPRAARDNAIDHFNAPGSDDFVFLLSTRAGGLGINLTTADTVVLFDIDWNPQNDLQAEARCHRVGQTKPVVVYRLISTGTVEEQILARNKDKLVLDHLMIQANIDSPDNADNDNGSKSQSRRGIDQILKFGAKELFLEKHTSSGNLDEDNDDPRDDDPDELLRNLDIDAVIAQAQAVNNQSSCSTTDEKNPAQKSYVSTFDNLMSSFKMAKLQQTVQDEKDQEGENDNNNHQEDTEFWNALIPLADQEHSIVTLAPLAVESPLSRVPNSGKKKKKKDDYYSRGQKSVSYREDDMTPDEDSDGDENHPSRMKKKKPKLSFQLVRALMRYGKYQDFPASVTTSQSDHDTKSRTYIEHANLPATDETLAQELVQSCEHAVLSHKDRGQKYQRTKVMMDGKEIKAYNLLERLYFNSKLHYWFTQCLKSKSKPSTESIMTTKVLLSMKWSLADLQLGDMTAWSWGEKHHEWNSLVDDLYLLLGVYCHGIGGWDDMSNDDDLVTKSRALCQIKGERLRTRVNAMLSKLPDIPTDTHMLSTEALLIFNLENVMTNKLDEQGRPSSLEKPAKKTNNNNNVSSKSNNSRKSRTTSGMSGRLHRAAERAAAKQGSSIKVKRSCGFKPKYQLKPIKQTLRKLACVHSWAQNRERHSIVWKVFKYLKTIGHAIADVVDREAESDLEAEKFEHECWKYVATFTSCSGREIYQLYLDICADVQTQQKDRSAKRSLETEDQDKNEPAVKRPKLELKNNEARSSSSGSGGGLLATPTKARHSSRRYNDNNGSSHSSSRPASYHSQPAYRSSSRAYPPTSTSRNYPRNSSHEDHPKDPALSRRSYR